MLLAFLCIIIAIPLLIVSQSKKEKTGESGEKLTEEGKSLQIGGIVMIVFFMIFMCLSTAGT